MKKLSTARKLIVYVVLLSSVLTLLTTAIQLYLGFKDDVRDIRAQLDSIASTQTDALSASLWSFDTDQVKIQVEGMVNYSKIAYVELKSPDFSYKFGEFLTKQFISKHYNLGVVSNNKHNDLGVLHIQVDLEDTYRDVQNRFLAVLISNAFKTFLVTFFMYWLFNRLVTAPVNKLVGFTLSETRDLNISEPEIGIAGDDVEKALRTVKAMIKQLKDSNKEMEHFCYSLSHDLKSPVVTIIGFLDLVRLDLTKKKQGDVEQHMRRIESAANKMLQLLHEVLQFIKFGQTPLHFERFNLKDAIDEAIELVDGTIRDHQIEVKIADTFPSVFGDRFRMVQVFQNLLDNAAKFHAVSKDRLVEIGTEEAGDNCVVYVRDNGKGIEPQFHEMIFGLFNILDSSRESTGVGLAIVKRIVDDHEWKIWVESDGLGTGSTFYIEIIDRDPTSRS